jgi:hypothetical protein
MIVSPLSGYAILVINPEDSDDCLVTWVESQEEEE